jgi:hypothetical protein
MLTYSDTAMIKAGSVEVIIDALQGLSVNNLQELAEKSWRSVNKITDLAALHSPDRQCGKHFAGGRSMRKSPSLSFGSISGSACLG